MGPREPLDPTDSGGEPSKWAKGGEKPAENGALLSWVARERALVRLFGAVEGRGGHSERLNREGLSFVPLAGLARPSRVPR